MKTVFARAVLAASVLIAASSPSLAASTKYYSRQKLVAVAQTPGYTYVPTYGAYGACSGGMQTASVSTCTRSDGAVVANSLCSPATKSQTCAQTITCGALSQYTYPAGSGSYLIPIAQGQTVLQACQAYIDSHGITTPMTCFYSTTGSTPNQPYLTPGNGTTYNSYPGTFTGNCK